MNNIGLSHFAQNVGKIMKCKYFTIRSKKYKKFPYCRFYKKEIEYSECNGCQDKEYKETKPIPVKKKERTKATSISQETKKIVWERDNHRCIICNKPVPMFYANAHFIKRSQGGMGIPGNVVTLCQDCHGEEDLGLNTKEYEGKIERYLQAKYGDNWNKENLVYKKGRE